MRYTVDQLLDQMKLNASIPTSQQKFSDARCLQFLNEELNITIQPSLLKLRAEFYVTHIDIPLVANTSIYELPNGVVGWSLYDWGYVDGNGEYRSLSQTGTAYLERFSEITTSDSPKFLYFEGTKINSRPLIGANAIGSIRLFYERTQSELVKVSDCGLVKSVVDLGTEYQINLDQLPIYADGVDVISGKSPYGIIAEDFDAIAVAGTSITLTKTGFDRAPVKGDYVAPTTKTCIPHIPDIAFPALAQASTIRLLEASGDTKGIQIAGTTLGRMMTAVEARCRDRVKARPKKILSKNFLLNTFRR